MSRLRQTSKRFACSRRGETQQGLALVAVTAVLALFGSLKIATDAVQRSAADDREERAITAERLAAAERALVRYVTVNGHLPCPADGMSAVRSGAGSASQPSPDAGTCDHGADTAVVPWSELGIQPGRALDGWDRRISYLPARDTAIEVERPGSTVSDVAFVLISHGENGLGAHTINGTHVPGVGGSSQDEQDNVDGDGGTPATFHAKPYRKGPGVAANAVFDDRVRFLTIGDLEDRSARSLDGLASSGG